MRKFFICLLTFLQFSSVSLAQTDQCISILTNDGIFTLSQTNDGKYFIIIRKEVWDDMVTHTKYVSEYLSVESSQSAHIEIANKDLQCRSGIGFRCSIFDCLNAKSSNPVPVNHYNRLCRITIEKQKTSTIKIIFLDNVDWISLQNDH